MRRILAIAAVAATAGLAVAVRPASAQSIPNITAAKTAATSAANATNRHTATVTGVAAETPSTTKPAAPAARAATPTAPAAKPAKGQPAKAQPAAAKPADAKPEAKPEAKPAASAAKAEPKADAKADANGAKPEAKADPKAAKPEAKEAAKPAAKDAKDAKAADQSRVAATVAPRDSAETIKVGAATNVARRGTASELTFSREVYSYPGRGRRDPFMSLLKSGDLRPLLGDLKLVTVLYDPTGRNSVAILRDLSTKPNDQYRVKLGQQLGRMRVAQIQPKQIVLTIEEFGYNRQEILALTSDSTRTR